MSDKIQNISSGAHQNLEPKTYALKEEQHIPDGYLASENKLVQDMCGGKELYNVSEVSLSPDEMTKLSDGKMIPVSGAVTSSDNTAGCTSSVVSAVWGSFSHLDSFEILNDEDFVQGI